MTENETKGWAALAATYQKCVDVATETWDGMIGLASAAQQKTAEEMRDRLITWPSEVDVTIIGGEYKTAPAGSGMSVERSIPVPLFTPRDRLQFLKEVSVTLLIEASKRGLSVTQPEDVGPMVKPFGKDKGTPLDKMSTEDLESSIAWLREHPAQLVKHGDFLMAADAEVTARAAKTAEIQTQPLNETPLALVPDDRPLPEAP